MNAGDVCPVNLVCWFPKQKRWINCTCRNLCPKRDYWKYLSTIQKNSKHERMRWSHFGVSRQFAGRSCAIRAWARKLVLSSRMVFNEIGADASHVIDILVIVCKTQKGTGLGERERRVVDQCYCLHDTGKPNNREPDSGGREATS